MSERTAARAFAAVYLVAGVVGFIPGELRESILLNLVHLLIGAVGFAVARAIDLALASLGLWLLGVFAAGDWLSLDPAKNWLHFVLGVGVLGVAAAVRRVSARPAV